MAHAQYRNNTTFGASGATLAARAAHATVGLAALAADDALAGPGWFESSWDLKRGLDVVEGAPADVSLDEWLAVCLK